MTPATWVDAVTDALTDAGVQVPDDVKVREMATFLWEAAEMEREHRQPAFAEAPSLRDEVDRLRAEVARLRAGGDRLAAEYLDVVRRDPESSVFRVQAAKARAATWGGE